MPPPCFFVLNLKSYEELQKLSQEQLNIFSCFTHLYIVNHSLCKCTIEALRGYPGNVDTEDWLL